MKRVMVALLAVMAITGCASSGLEQPVSFDQRLAYGYGTHTAVLQAAAVSVQNGSLSKADGQTILKMADQAGAALDAAKAIEGTDPNAAQDKLTLALNVLLQVQSYLDSHRSKP